MLKPGGRFFGNKLNHMMTPEQFRAAVKHGFIFDKEVYQDGD
jgi:hypothetical protein